ncbi:porin family protein [Pseudochrobactrum sp. Wa41.01b-1]|uniref:outer membrane protein n=1 Tax=Pseudochrobactrum sp. Wa41.01b-1 TaxID=2864102 RepID=UPI001C68B5EF|nr:outer membrane protein [Pseudochrobactrum sp. Wa41.01b-1]QYM72846.1 porin family protein [Pseudochrobactrum sp. Wa41.01b-1]
MKHFKTLALVSASALSFAVSAAVPASAADIVYTQPETPVPVVLVSPQNNWKGGYVGIYLGGGANILKEQSSDDNQKSNNTGYGGYAGWNFQNDNIVYGVEGDVGYNVAKKADDDLTVRRGLDSSLRARLGYDSGSVMPYITAGVAGTQVRDSNDADSEKKFRTGWTAGAGVETMLTQNVSAKLEYRYSDFGTKNITMDNVAVPAGKLQSHDIRLGIGYKF